MTAGEQRCELTELLVDQCACPAHRGGQVADDEQLDTVGQPFTAGYASRCARGCTGIEPGDDIVRCWDAAIGYAHLPGGCP